MGRKIVIVDDNPADTKMLRMALAECDSEVQTIELPDGLAAVEFFSKAANQNGAVCDLIVLDLNLPRLNGFEVLEFLKSKSAVKSIPVVVMSGSSSQQDMDLANSLGADEYLVKPTDLDDIFVVGAQLIHRWCPAA